MVMVIMEKKYQTSEHCAGHVDLLVQQANCWGSSLVGRQDFRVDRTSLSKPLAMMGVSVNGLKSWSASALV